MLEIYLFGPFEVRRDGQSLCSHWVRHANRLLALLTLNHNRAVRTDWILDALLLPETVLPQSLQVLYDLFGEDRDRIRHGNRQVYFNTGGITVDAFEFERLIGKNTLETLVKAVAIHRGGLLRDWEEEGWFSEERETYLADYLDVINTLAKAAIEAEDYDRAASYFRKYVNAYPEMDSAWVRLIEVYGLAGNTSVVEVSKKRYLESLSERSKKEGRSISPSRYVLQACEQALRSPSSAPSTFSARPSSRAFVSNLSASSSVASAFQVLEPVGGAVPLESAYYLSRPSDDQVFAALARQDSFILVKGARQVGKSSLLVRVLHRARESGAQVVRTDWQKISQSSLETARSFLLDIADTFVDYLDLNARPEAHFEPGRAVTTSFERFLRREVLSAVPNSLVWIIDEADRIFDCAFRDDIFAMLRSWHGERANDFTGKWQKLTVVLAYATEAYLFISNLDQSPFNIGSRFELDDFYWEQVCEMNRRYGNPLSDEEDVARLYALVGGHPYLIRRSLQEIILRQLCIADVEENVENGGSLFTDHLGRMRLALLRDPAMVEALRAYLTRGNTPSYDLFVRLRAAGAVRGSSPENMQMRCRLYDIYLRKVLL